MWKIILSATSLLFLLLYLMLFSPFPLVPEIGRDLPPKYSEGRSVFLERVKNHFPVQSNEADMIHKLEDQGFTVNSKTKEAYFSKSRFPCQLNWRISWLSEGGLITSVDASYGSACL